MTPLSNPLIQTTVRAIVSTLTLFSMTLMPSFCIGAEWKVPLAGNAYRTSPTPGNHGFSRQGPVKWSSKSDVISVFFHLDQPSSVQLAINATSISGPSHLSASIGDQVLHFTVSESSSMPFMIGNTAKLAKGYARLDLRANPSGEFHAIEASELLISSDTEALKVSFVQNNQGNMFYWGRRGPSVHLRYKVPRQTPLTYAYSEITVPVTQDPIGTYYMANGFGEGYFGIQVNSSTERRVLFSVWSPFRTDNPREIPADQKIIALGKGKDVHLGEFGNEGSGGQSYLVYPWEAGRTYRFLTEVIPNGDDKTTYTSWFGDVEKDEWRLIASFQRPKTDTHLRGFHSFLESFDPTRGHLVRRGDYGNVWVRDTDAKWHPCSEAVFSVDATGGGNHRLDFTGGSDGEKFFLRNCGFFNEQGQPGATFERLHLPQAPPSIDFDSLPR